MPLEIRQPEEGHPEHWATPQAHDVAQGDPKRVGRYGQGDNNGASRNLTDEVVAWQALKNWGTPRADEWKGTGPKGSVSQQYRLDKGYLDAQVEEYADGGRATPDPEKRSLNPDWEEILMGWPTGWTDLDNPCSGVWPGWPAGQGLYQHPYEPPRTVPRCRMKNRTRTGRIKAIGNGVVPQSAEAAFVRLFSELLAYGR